MGNRSGRTYLYSLSNRETTTHDVVYVPRGSGYMEVRLAVYLMYMAGYVSAFFLKVDYWWFIALNFVVATFLWVNLNAWQHKRFLKDHERSKSPSRIAWVCNPNAQPLSYKDHGSGPMDPKEFVKHVVYLF